MEELQAVIEGRVYRPDLDAAADLIGPVLYSENVEQLVDFARRMLSSVDVPNSASAADAQRVVDTITAVWLALGSALGAK